MARFFFSLDKVLRWRSVELSAEEAKLKRLVQEEQQLQTRRIAMQTERSKVASSPGTLPDVTGSDLRSVTAYGLRLRREAETLAHELVRCQRDLAAQRKSYNEAKRRTRLLEELKKRKLEEWTYEQGRLLEELASESFLANWNREQK
jgi:flagellar export protein FliJ